MGISGVPSSGSKPGVLVERADTPGPAASAGLRPGDVIQAIDGRAVSKMEDVQSILSAHEPGQSISLRVLRSGHEKTMTVQLANRPAQAPSS